MAGKWSGAFQVSAVYVGTVIGAGFATGKEIVEFFTQYGPYGLFGIAVSGVLFAWLGAKMMVMAARINAASYKDLNDYLFGRAISSFITFIMTAIVLGVTSVMLSGAGTVFEEQLGMPKYVGLIVTVFFAFIVMLFGIKGLFGVNIVIVPMMIGFTLIISGMALSDIKWGSSSAIFPVSSLKSLFSPFAYASFNLAMAQIVLVPLASEIKDEQIIRRGAVLGGALLLVVLASCHVALSSLPDVMKYDIPMAEVIKIFFASLYWLYVLVIYGEIFTSLIGGIFGLQKQLSSFLPISNVSLLCLILAILYLISLVDYSSLLSFLYPLFGYVSLVLLILLAFRKIPK